MNPIYEVHLVVVKKEKDSIVIYDEDVIIDKQIGISYPSNRGLEAAEFAAKVAEVASRIEYSERT